MGNVPAPCLNPSIPKHFNEAPGFPMCAMGPAGSMMPVIRRHLVDPIYIFTPPATMDVSAQPGCLSAPMGQSTVTAR